MSIMQILNSANAEQTRLSREEELQRSLYATGQIIQEIEKERKSSWIEGRDVSGNL